MQESNSTYAAYASRRIFFGQRAHLESELHKRPRYEAREDYAAQGAVEEGLEMALFWTCGGGQYNSCYIRDSAPTSNANCRPDIDFYGRFLWHLVSAQHLDRSVDGANDGEAVVGVCRRAICAVQVGEGDLWDGHCDAISCIRVGGVVCAMSNCSFSNTTKVSVGPGRSKLRSDWTDP